MIADGTLKPGGTVPSARTLHSETGISEAYCLRALRLLVAEGTLVRPGSLRFLRQSE
jgi:DNA-binding GntR family transcriptional regulator